MIKIIEGILGINPDAKVAVRGDNLDECVIEWHQGTPEISKADIQTKMNELQTEYDALAYARARDVSYPNLKEFAEAYTEKEIGGDSTKWDLYVTKYNKVRTDNPKG